MSVSNYPKMLAPRLAQEAPQHSAAATATLEQMGQHIQQRTVIKRKGKSPFKPRARDRVAGRASPPVDDAVSSKRGFDG